MMWSLRWFTPHKNQADFPRIQVSNKLSTQFAYKLPAPRATYIQYKAIHTSLEYHLQNYPFSPSNI